jgi:predicted HicB family RNase H-like nuclease
MFKYKGYFGKAQFDDELEIFHGEVVNTRDIITFQGSSVKELKKSFEESVDDYLDLCRKRGEDPEKPFSGRFVVRISPEVHRKAHSDAKRAGKSLNAWVTDVIDRSTTAREPESAYGLGIRKPGRNFASLSPRPTTRKTGYGKLTKSKKHESLKKRQRKSER